MMASSNCDIFLASRGGSLVNVVEAHPSLADAYKTGKSSCSSKRLNEHQFKILFYLCKRALRITTKAGESKGPCFYF